MRLQFSFILLVTQIWGFHSSGYGSSPLSDYVQTYEGLTYDTSRVHNEHGRHKRSTEPRDEPVTLDFVAHGRRFRVELERDHSVFHNDLVVVDSDDRGITDRVDLSHIYHGKVVGDPGSQVFGSIRDGVFDGQIVTSRHGTYFVERIQKYPEANFSNDLKRKNNNESSSSPSCERPKRSIDDDERAVHSVIYHERHVKDPFQHKKHVGSKPGCGVTDSVQSWMESVSTSATDPADENLFEDPTNEDENSEEENRDAQNLDFEDPFFKYSGEANSRRRKRSAENPNKKKSCSLYIQTDPLFWRHIRDQEGDDAKTEEEILSLIAQHVKAVNRIYSESSFNGKYKHHGYQFEVQRIKIHNDSLCKSSGNVIADQNQFCIPNVDVSNFLNLHSKSNHEEFCLAYVFTYRDFTGGTLGLAWVASATGASGGICETYKRYTDNINGVQHATKRSLNTGIITFINYNSRVPPKVSQLTLAHEIGHNFGSPHDYPEQCRPGGAVGNFIMFASATSGDRDNNNKFSDCSKSNISAVLDAIADGRKQNCFTESDGAFCGNKIVEEGEECDCGFDENECAEQCCYPRKIEGVSTEENNQKRCKRKPGAKCSPSEGPCCRDTCTFWSSFENVKCKNEDDCNQKAICNGLQSRCPEPSHKPDNVTECNEGTQVCQRGECRESICLKYGLASCFLTSAMVDDKRELCELACQGPNGTCMSTKSLMSVGLINEELLGQGLDGLSLRPGSPCDNFQGYCDVFLKCRKVDAEGPLLRLKKLLFNQKTLTTIATWVTEFWWAVLLMAIGFVIVMSLFIKCFAIHTPSSNPNLPKNLHFSETLRRPVRSLQQKHYRPANQNIPASSRGGHSSRSAAAGSAGQQHQQSRSGHDRSNGARASASSAATASTAVASSSSAATPSRDAPPPYPGGRPGQVGGPGPGHGYGNGRGHYNRQISSSSSSSQAQTQQGQLLPNGGGQPVSSARNLGGNGASGGGASSNNKGRKKR